MVLLGGPVVATADVTGAQVRDAVRRGMKVLRSWQGEDGRWPERHLPGGETALATLALLYAGEPPDSPHVLAALPHVRDQQNQHVYVVSLKIMVLAQADPEAYRREIREAALWLADAQNSSGLWSYTPHQEPVDHSNTQFALLGLHAAAQVGMPIPASVWRKAHEALLAAQNEDGGWGYRQGMDSRGSMTAAGVSDLIIVGSRLVGGRELKVRKGEDPACGRTQINRPIAEGLIWLARHFTARRHPGLGTSHIHYWLYAAERCGMLSGQGRFGRHDWYREGAAYLVGKQLPNGSWGDDLVETCFALLFLAKGHKALLLQKLQWSDDDEWNPDPRGVDHLISFIGDKLGEPVTWQAVPFDAPLEDWLAAPLLYIHGRTFPEWNAAQQAKVRAFVEQGGTLFVGACCGRKEFRDGFEAFLAATFPETPLRELGEDHAVYHVIFDCPTSDLLGVDIGCRTSILFAPKDLSYLWQSGDVPPRSELALQLGTNIAAYATGRRPLVDRLDAVVLPEAQEMAAGPPSRDALRFGQVVYDGDWRPFPQALVHLADFARREAGLDVITQYHALRLTDSELYTCPFLYMAGHYGLELSPEEQAALVAHLRRGGFLLVDNCCGPEPFDTAVRKLMREAFPGSAFRRLPADHPIYQGSPGFDVRTVRYGPDIREKHPDLNRPELWGIEIDGRLAVVYSPFALGCGLEGKEFAGCWGLAAEDARRLATNIVLYALTH